MKINSRLSMAFMIFLALMFSGIYYLIVHQRLQAPRWSLSTASLTIDDTDRHFTYFVPDGIEERPALLFVLHGSKGSPGLMRYLTNYEFEKIVQERKNTILVYPQGLDKHWNDCRRSAIYRAKLEQVDDVAFFRAMIAYFSKEFDIDEQSIFATGFSNGGHMCLKLAYEMPEALKGIALFAANAPDLSNNDCLLSGQAVSVMIINGTADPINPYDGGLVVLNGDSSRGSVYSAAETIEYWAGILPGPTQSETIIYEDPAIEHQKISCTDGAYKVELVSVKEGGHTIPLLRPAPYLPRILGATNTQLNGPELVIDFFENLN